MIAVYSLASQCGHWNNAQLLKECGLIPFMLHKSFGCKAVMVGENAGDYPYLERLPGLDMDFIPDSGGNIRALIKSQIDYVNQNYQKIDVLIMRGLYPATCYILQAYKRRRPDGKVYLYLDANARWANEIPWNSPPFFGALKACDLISTSCLKMANFLNEKWQGFTIEHIPNGFYGQAAMHRQGEKEDIILTAGRIGSEQKANHILMLAFAIAAEEIPSWKLRLAGPVENEFHEFVGNYFKKFPHLKERVEFTGNIADKERLYSEYAKAKIFALTSEIEGGAPNVIAEALFHGCYQVCSDIDAASEITDNGNCGRVFPIGDYNALAEILLEVCANEELLQNAPQKAVQFAKKHYDWDLIIGKVGKFLYSHSW